MTRLWFLCQGGLHLTEVAKILSVSLGSHYYLTNKLYLILAKVQNGSIFFLEAAGKLHVCQQMMACISSDIKEL